MSVPKHSTIVRYCDNGTAITILRDRGIITGMEAEALYARERRASEQAYAGIYSTALARLVENVLAEARVPEHVIEAATAAIGENDRAWS